MDRHFKIIVAGYNCFDMIQNCVESIANQTYTDYEVCLVDDASTDIRQAPVVEQFAQHYKWKYLLRTENAGALRSQHEGITLLDPQDGNVIVWVDMDDAFSSSNSLAILNEYYDEDTFLTYGSYKPVPFEDQCPPAVKYPIECEQKNDYRNMHKWGIRYNHLRTVTWDLYKHLNIERDFYFNGRWMHLASDCAVMIPCLELAGGKYKCIPEILYNYTSDNPISEWRKSPRGTDEMHAALIAAPRKEPLQLTLDSVKKDVLDIQYDYWIQDGSPLDQNGSVPHEVKMYYVLRTLRDYGIKTFIESGTSHGDGIAYILPHVDSVYSIEAWQEAYEYAHNRFKNDSNVNLYFGDSGILLPSILNETGPAVFWLDAHYSGDGTANLDKETPIVAELEGIAMSSHSDEHAIVIDDARGFGQWKDYPSIPELEDLCKNLFPNHKFHLEGDEIFILPKS